MNAHYFLPPSSGPGGMAPHPMVSAAPISQPPINEPVFHTGTGGISGPDFSADFYSPKSNLDLSLPGGISSPRYANFPSADRFTLLKETPENFFSQGSSSFGDFSLCKDAYLNDRTKNIREALFYRKFMESYTEIIDAWCRFPVTESILLWVSTQNCAVKNAILAVGALHYKRRVNNLVNDHVIYYSLATQNLSNELKVITSNNFRNIDSCLCSSILLCLYEVMLNGFKERPSHINGSKALIDSLILNKVAWDEMSLKNSLIEAFILWNSAYDLSFSIDNGLHCLWNPDDWANIVGLFKPDQIPDSVWWHQKINYLLTMTHNFSMRDLHPGAIQTESNKIYADALKWKSLFNDICEWERLLPNTLRPLCCLEASQLGTGVKFPRIIMPSKISTLALIVYHTASIIILKCRSDFASFIPDPIREPIIGDPIYHAHQIIGIISSQDDVVLTGIMLHCQNKAVSCLVDPFEIAEANLILQDFHANVELDYSLHEKMTDKKWKMLDYDI